MEVFYKHKETGCLISLSKLKEMRQSDNLIRINSPIFESKLKDEMVFEAKAFTYWIGDIPFSDDFEVVLKDDTFSRNELCYILDLINNNSIATYDERYYKLINKLYDLREQSFEKGFRNGY